MKARPILLGLIVSVAYAIPAAAVDNRFDGIWAGTETVMGQEFRGGSRVPSAVKKPAKIAIAQGGTLLGVLEGYGPGRYMDIRRDGDTIVFRAGNRMGQVRLSPDGQTLMEKGVIPGFLMTNIYQREGALSGHTQTIPLKGTAEVTGTFHRVSK